MNKASEQPEKKLYTFYPPKGKGYEKEDVARFGEGTLEGNKFTGIIWSSEYKTRPLLERPDIQDGSSEIATTTAWYYSVSGTAHHYATDKVIGLEVINAKELTKEQESDFFKSKKQLFEQELKRRGFIVNTEQPVKVNAVFMVHKENKKFFVDFFKSDNFYIMINQNNNPTDKAQFKSVTLTGLDDQIQKVLTWIDNKLTNEQEKTMPSRFQIGQIVKFDDEKTSEQIKGIITGISEKNIAVKVNNENHVLDESKLIKSYISKPPNIPEVKLGNKRTNEDYYIYINKFQDSFPNADIDDINKISSIAYEMTKLSVKRCNDREMTEDIFNKKTDILEIELKQITDKYPKMRAALDYEPRGAAIKLQMPTKIPQSQNIYVPEHSSRKFEKTQNKGR